MPSHTPHHRAPPRGPARAGLALAGLLIVAAATPAPAEPLAPTGGAGNTGVRPPAGTGHGSAGQSRPLPAPPGVADGGVAARTVPGSTPGINIGGTPTSGPPGTGGAAGGPGFGR